MGIKYFLADRKKVVSGLLAIVAALGWWGMLYPQYTLLESTYAIVDEDGKPLTDENLGISELDSAKLYWKLLDTESDHIRFKSKVLSFLAEVR